MNYPSKRVEFSVLSYMMPEYHYWTDMTTENFALAAEYGVDTVIWFDTHNPSWWYGDFIPPDKETSLDTEEPFLVMAEDAGLKVMLDSQNQISEGGIHTNWQVADYENAYGAIFDELETDSRVVGYFTEVPSPEGTEWLRAKTAKVMSLNYFGYDTRLSPTQFSDMVQANDEVVFELFNLHMSPNSIAILPTLHNIKPTLKIGEWDQCLPLWPGDIALYWAPFVQPYKPPPPPYDTAQQRSGNYLAGSDTQQHLSAYWIGLVNAECVNSFGHGFDIDVMQDFDCQYTFEDALWYHQTRNSLISSSYTPHMLQIDLTNIAYET